MRFLIPATVMLDDCDPAQAEAFEAAVEALCAAGAQVTRAPVPEFAEALAVAATRGAIVNTEGYGVWGDAIEANPDAMFPLIRERFRSGRAFRADQIDGARLAFARLAKAFLARLAPFDALISPTTANLPPSVAALSADDGFYIAQNLLALRNTRLGNLFGLCGLTIPTGRPGCGLLFTGAPFEEARLLRIGAAAEAALQHG